VDAISSSATPYLDMISRRGVHDNLMSQASTSISSLSSSVHLAGPTGLRRLTLGNDEVLQGLYNDYEGQLSDLKRRLENGEKALRAEKKSGHEKQQAIDGLRETVEELEAKERLGFLLNRLSDDAQRLLLESKEFENTFLSPERRDAFVVSIDIRRSTELMLKARSPENFARFITALCGALTETASSRSILTSTVGRMPDIARCPQRVTVTPRSNGFMPVREMTLSQYF
jgi:hypothetical protein